MMNKTIAISAVVSVLMIQGCASPHVVETKKINDQNLSCSQLVEQVNEAENFEKKARAERKVTGTNVAAAVFFWPALLGTYANTEEAIEAAKERKKYLTTLYEKKGCK